MTEAVPYQPYYSLGTKAEFPVSCYIKPSPPTCILMKLFLKQSLYNS